MKNTLKCNITGTERVTNVPYLAKKADRLGITVEEYKANYVSKAALVELKAKITDTCITDVAMELNTTQAQVEAYVNYNGKNRFAPPTPVDTTEFIPMTTEELATA
jgi:hypothetical protein